MLRFFQLQIYYIFKVFNSNLKALLFQSKRTWRYTNSEQSRSTRSFLKGGFPNQTLTRPCLSLHKKIIAGTGGSAPSTGAGRARETLRHTNLSACPAHDRDPVTLVPVVPTVSPNSGPIPCVTTAERPGTTCSCPLPTHCQVGTIKSS